MQKKLEKVSKNSIKFETCGFKDKIGASPPQFKQPRGFVLKTIN